MNTMKLTLALPLVGAVMAGPSRSLANDETDKRWGAIQAQLFAEGTAIVEDEFWVLTAPTRAEHAAIVPIEVEAGPFPSTTYLKKLYLVVDANPSPVVGVFTFSEKAEVVGLSTRVRVNAYSFVRAIGQTSDGVFHMTKSFVKASGGCSAPPTLADEVAIKRRGKMKLKERSEVGHDVLRLMVSHPNHSGLQIDQLSRNWIPPDYVQDIALVFAGEEFMSFHGGISMSENPSVRLRLRPLVDGQLSAKIEDSKGRTFVETWPIRRAGHESTGE